MNVLWIVNTLSPKISNIIGVESGHAISWVEAMSEKLSLNKDIKLTIVTTFNAQEVKKAEVGNITYYCLPSNEKMLTAWDSVISDICPDVIHVYGTEKWQNLSLITAISEKIPVVISLQGIITEYEKRYFAGINIYKNIKCFFAEFVLRKGIFLGKKSFKKQSVIEKKMLNAVKYVEGRSDWDRVMSEQISANRKYYTCPRMIRSAFFKYSWDIANAEPYSIFVHQGNYPIKGLHFLLKAVAVLKKKYPNVRLYISGNDFMTSQKGIRRYVKNGYIKYINGIISEFNLRENISFTGYLEADKLAETLSKVSVCVNPSAIENAPNSVAEAMIVGTPCVASYVGGSPEMLDNGKAGYLYRYDEYAMLADRISYVFENPNDACLKSDYSRELSRKRHDPNTLESKLISIYSDVIDDFNNSKTAY